MTVPRLLVIYCSTRPGRVCDSVGRWFVEVASEHGAFDIDVADLAELRLPMMDEPKHPRFREYVHEHTKNWSDTVATADALVLVTPEYNHGYPAALKNALDYLFFEWQHKAVGCVSYGGISGGTRSVQQLKQVTAALGMMSCQVLVNIAWIGTRLAEDGALIADDEMVLAATGMLDELLLLDSGLQALRAQAGAPTADVH